MTINTSTNSASFPGNGVTQIFPCDFRIFQDSDVLVSLVDPNTGATTNLVLDSDYTISGAGDQGGFTLSTTSAPPTGLTLLVQRDIAIEQVTDFTNQGSFFPTMHEDTADRTVMQVQQVNELAVLGLRKPNDVVNFYDVESNRLSNVAAGLDSTDGANVAQVNSAQSAAQAYADQVTAGVVGGYGYFQQAGSTLGRTFQNKMRDFVSVTDFKDTSGNIAGSGGDDTSAFIAAANICPTVYVPFGSYHLNAAVLPKGTQLFGYSPIFYHSADVGSRAAVLNLASGATSLFAVTGNVILRGLVVIGNAGAGNLFSPGNPTLETNHVRLENCSIFKLAAGVDGSAFSGYLGGVLAFNCTFAENGTGIKNIVDSWIIGGSVNANTGPGISLGSGANDNTIIGTKVEWNGANNVELYASTNNVIVGGVYDRSTNDGISIGNNAEVTITGTMLRRSGRAGGTTTRHISIGGGCKVVINAIRTRTGADDDGSGATTPVNTISFTGAPTSVVVSGSDLTGCTSTTPILSAGNAAATYRVQGCPNMDDIKDLKNYGTVAAGATAYQTFTFPGFGTFANTVPRFKVRSRDTTSGSIRFGIVPIIIARGSGNASATVCTQEYTSTSGGVGITSSDTIQLIASAVAADGSTLTLQVNNNHATNGQSVQIELA